MNRRETNSELTEREILAKRERQFEEFARSLGRSNLVSSRGTVGPDPHYAEGRPAEDLQIPADIHGRRIGRLPGRLDGSPMTPNFEPALEQIVSRLSRPPQSPDEIAEARVIEILDNMRQAYACWRQTRKFSDLLGVANMIVTYLRGDPDLPLTWNVPLVARLRVESLIAVGAVLGRPEYWDRALGLMKKYYLPPERHDAILYMLRRLEEMEETPSIGRRATKRELVRQHSGEPVRTVAEKARRIGVSVSKSEVARIRRELCIEQTEEAA